MLFLFLFLSPFLSLLLVALLLDGLALPYQPLVETRGRYSFSRGVLSFLVRNGHRRVFEVLQVGYAQYK